VQCLACMGSDGMFAWTIVEVCEQINTSVVASHLNVLESATVAFRPYMLRVSPLRWREV
jgi:hypothetical protein